jgi:gas vesicle protein
MDKYTLDQESDVKKPAGFLKGLFLGSLAGAATMLLFAPQSGQETRQKLQEKALKLSDQTTATVGDVMNQVRTKAGEIKVNVSDKANELKKQGQDVLAEQLDRVSVAAETGKKAIQGKGS